MIMASISNGDTQFVFEHDNAILASHERVAGAGFKSTDLLSAKPRQQLVGGVLDRRTLSGVCYSITAENSVENLYAIKEAAKPVVLIISGRVLGQWVVQQVRSNYTETNPDGSSRVVKFTVQLEEYANESNASTA